jgi:DNA adenine methylase
MKYMGSKAKIAKEFLEIILKNRRDGQYYVEPFAGGMNSVCLVGGNVIANDFHHYLIEMWKSLIGGWIPEKITKEFYVDVKNNKDNYPKHVVGWVGFNCSYSGKYFGGFAGDCKTKIGTIRDYQSEAISNVMKQVPSLKNVLLENKSYLELEIPKNSLIYCDPPYEGTTKYSNEVNHVEFWNWVRKMSKGGHEVFVSEYNAPEDFEVIWKKDIKSSLSANGKIGGSKISTEKLFKLK